MLRIAWKPNNLNTAHHDIYVSAASMSWPDNMPSSVTYAATPGEWEVLLDLDPLQTWYVMIVARRQKDSGAWEYAASDLWTYQGIPLAAWEGGGLYEDVSGILSNSYEHMTTPLPGLRNATLTSIEAYTHLDPDRMLVPAPFVRNATLVSIGEISKSVDNMAIPTPGIRNMKLTTA